ncbi:Fpg/Nei family DNA glycosylase [Streptomyces sp. LX-29]|uniref:Fpg/Nei family DNA glycosylase n=1 Tax=Streptomyces sp. LX-29 TaxID=2900152 RepID=UPI00240E451A|nr:DNA-formamidopyrimidine glycosylase family protein [Streptomyces sp. LX-29]WFB05985.1 Fpg/Nei family DNA glycosylase [Streptomyces sp. LX-29]
MPELPDVEGFLAVFRSCGQGRRVERIQVRDAGVLRGVSGARLRARLRGRRFGEPWRHGKRLVTPTDGPALVWHFGMTGELLCASADDPPAAHDRLLLSLDDGRQLRYRDQRKLQGVQLAADDAAVERILAGLGPDALDVGRVEFAGLLAGRRGAIKATLMDQSVTAGLGNLLCDEILWRARLAPTRVARDLSEEECRTLHASLRRVLKSAVPTGRVPPRRTWLIGRRDDPEPECPRCDAPLRSRRVSGRRTVWCDRCQS